MNKHEPQLADPALEQLMESKELPESDRDEVRASAELFAFIRKRREGDAAPVPDWMRDFATGEA